MKKDSIDHFAITVSDIDASAAWYLSSFECEIIYKDNKQVLIQFENIKLTLVLPSQERPHFAVCRDDAKTFGALRELPNGVSSCFIADPTGNPVELIQTNQDKIEKS